jgi:antitoxin HicB
VSDRQRRLPAPYLELQYPLSLYPESEGGYTAEIRDLPGCLGQGESAEQALEAIDEARRLWLEEAYEQGDAIPLPTKDEQYSGRILLRLPRTLHRRLVEQAQLEGTSLNQYLVSVLSEASALQTVRREIQKVKGG